MMELTDKIDRIEELLSKKKKIFVYHRDSDGVTSTALLLRYFPADSFSLEYANLDSGTVYTILEKRPEVVVLLDLAVDQYWENIKELEKKADVLMIDHHLFDRDLNSDKTLYINPRLKEKGIYLSNSYLIYHLLKKMGKPVEKLSWIAGIGVIGDFAFEEGKDVLEDVKKTNPDFVEGKPRESRLGLAEKLISSAITLRGEKGSEKVLEILLKTDNFEDFEKNEQLIKWNTEVEEEVNRVVERFEKDKEYYEKEKLAIFEFKSKLSITSTISTILSEKNPDITLIIRKKLEDGFKLSVRNQSGKVNLNTILRKVCKDIGRGGGHEKAAGAFVTDWDEFKKRFLKELR